MEMNNEQTYKIRKLLFEKLRMTMKREFLIVFLFLYYSLGKASQNTGISYSDEIQILYFIIPKKKKIIESIAFIICQ